MPDRRIIILFAVSLLLLAVVATINVRQQNQHRARLLQEQAQIIPSEMVRAMRIYFPDEWADIERQRQTGQNDVALGAIFMSAKLRNLADAPDAALLDIIRNEAALTRRLQDENIDYCAEFITAGPASAREYSPVSSVLVDKIAASAVIAAGQGIETPTPRNDDPDANYQALKQAMKDRDIPQRLIDNLGTPELSPAEQCQAGLSLYETLLSLPVPKAASLYATLKYSPT